MSDLITKLLPILHVRDPGAERSFYEQLGLRTTYQGPDSAWTGSAGQAGSPGRATAVQALTPVGAVGMRCLGPGCATRTDTSAPRTCTLTCGSGWSRNT
jgi:hypothetical protein